MVSSSNCFTGSIKWYNGKKGFGFITPDAGGQEVFLHRSGFNATYQGRIAPNDRVTFFVEANEKGPMARNVTRLEEPLETEPVAEAVALNEESPEQAIAAALPEPIESGFADFGLLPSLLHAVKDAGYVEPTPIQVQGIPQVLAGRDLLGGAQTGTGKTAAFALPILQLMAKYTITPTQSQRTAENRNKVPKKPVRVLVLSPTRELAIQTADFFSTYGKYTKTTNAVIYGGVGQDPQVQALKRGVDILVATPGRLLDLIGQGFVRLEQVEILVLDEADRMLDMGFIHDVRKIVKLVPRNRQTLLFSATLAHEIVELAGDILRDPVEVSVSPEQPTVELIDQSVFFVEKQEKQALLERLLADPAITRALVFTRTKHGANKVVKHLNQVGINAAPIHGNKSQTARQQALKDFRDGRTRVLVATDVASRGIDVEDISHVIQFDLPTVPETYIHRIGRTARAGATGIAIAFCEGGERTFLKNIEKLIRMRVPVARKVSKS
ncbi:MAG TPA: DEAD/DEAH box helicase [Candidatus Lokiarchaeia archaeon]|nr:DEAD/DEAH box helicase [Candidatus Lokiarchaeia archaeon]